MKKACNVCVKVKDASKFYKNAGMRDGYANRCIECTKKASKDRTEKLYSDPITHKEEKKRGREKYHRLNYRGKYTQTPEAKRKTILKYQNKFPEKNGARSMSSSIKRLSECIHHWSYNELHWKDVFHLTNKQHYIIHRFIIYDAERFMYRRFDNNVLLDTRERHETFIKSILRKEPY